LKIAQLNSEERGGENSELISGKLEGKEGEVSLRNLRKKEEEEGECKTQKLRDLKGSVSRVPRPPVLILPEGNHGYREGMPPYVAEPREEKRQGRIGIFIEELRRLDHGGWKNGEKIFVSSKSTEPKIPFS
jgi:hypothetical protein